MLKITKITLGTGKNLSASTSIIIPQETKQGGARDSTAPVLAGKSSRLILVSTAAAQPGREELMNKTG